MLFGVILKVLTVGFCKSISSLVLYFYNLFSLHFISLALVKSSILIDLVWERNRERERREGDREKKESETK